MVVVTISEPHEATFKGDFGLATSICVRYAHPTADARGNEGFRVDEGDFWYWDDPAGREFEGFEVLEVTPHGAVVRWIRESLTDRGDRERTPDHKLDYDHLTYDWIGELVRNGTLRVFGRDTGFEHNSPVPHSRYV
jgi:hypothetical protein